jgi:multidrug efflux system membrane fusion protein
LVIFTTSSQSKSKRQRWIFWISSSLILIGICLSAPELRSIIPSSAPKPSATQPAAPTIATVQTKRRDVFVELDGLGTVQAFNTVTVKPRVGGRIDDLAFSEGQRAHPGTILAHIDPRPYAAALHQARSAKQKDEAQLANNRLDVNRSTNLAQKGYAATQLLDTQRAAVASQEALVDADAAAIEAAQVQLDYATVTSPIEGIVGIRMIDAGNVIQPTDPGIVVVTQLEPITVIFTLPAAQVASLPVGKPDQPLPVTALGPDRTTALAEGHLELVDNRIDPTTGMVRLKAVFGNRDHVLKPGQFVTARLRLETLRNVVALPQAVIQQDPQGTYVVLVDDQSRTHRHPVSLGRMVAGQTVVSGGLNGDETVVLADQYGLKDGTVVQTRSSDGGPEQVAALPGLP